MPIETILRVVAKRGGVLIWEEGKLWVKPKSVLDDVLRRAMHENRTELEAWAKAQSTPFVGVALAIFDGEIVATIDVEADAAAGHIPPTILPTCRTVGGKCRAYTDTQINAMNTKKLMQHTQNCGDCDLIQTDMKLARLKAKREKREEKERWQDWRKDRFVVGATHDEED
jgi:hypothetical protein